MAHLDDMCTYLANGTLFGQIGILKHALKDKGHDFVTHIAAAHQFADIHS